MRADLLDLGRRRAQLDSDGLIRIPLTQSEPGELAGVAARKSQQDSCRRRPGAA